MKTISSRNRRNRQARWATAIPLSFTSVFAFLAAFGLTTSASGQVRTKKPDRGVYQPGRGIMAPIVETETTEAVQPVLIKPVKVASPLSERPSSPRLVERPAQVIQQASFEEPTIVGTPQIVRGQEQRLLRQVSPQPPQRRRIHQDETLIDYPIGSEAVYEGNPYGELGWAGEPVCGTESVCGPSCGGCDGCGYSGCGYGGCDGYVGPCGSGRICNSSLSFDPCRWFGSLEVLLMFRKGDLIPALVTNDGPEAGDVADPNVLFGGDKLFHDMTAGGRVTLGTWIDSCRSRSLVFRLWSATESDESFSVREPINGGNALSIPTTVGGADNLSLIAFPDSAENFGRFGSITASANSNVYGGDISARQYWTGGLGTTYDILYGYQYMRLDEDLRLSSSSTINQENLPLEVGDNITQSDSFDTSNEFHGGQFGLAGRYREGYWSFNFLAKVGFGQLRRRAVRTGKSVITQVAPPDVDEQDTGLLINAVNRGTFEDDTFGWVPELDVSLGWYRNPRFDITFGYQIIAMTDAVRVSGAMDPDNTVDTPRVGLDYETFYLHGLHFGVRSVY